MGTGCLPEVEATRSSHKDYCTALSPTLDFEWEDIGWADMVHAGNRKTQAGGACGPIP